MKKKLVLWFTTFTIMLIIIFILGEISLRLLLPNLPPEDQTAAYFCRNRQFDYRFMKPNVKGYIWSEEFPSIELIANSNGYRDENWNDQLKYPVMLLGDSFGWGWACPEDSMIPNVMEEDLDSISIFNLSIPGDDISNYYYRYRYHFEVIKPKHIVILNYINDFHDILNQEKIIESANSSGRLDTTLNNIKCDYHYDSGLRGYLSKSYLFRFINRFRMRRGISFTSEQLKKQIYKQAFEKEAELFKDRKRLYSEFNAYFKVLEEMSKNAPITIVYIPPAYQIEASKRNERNEVFGAGLIQPEWINDNLKRITDSLSNIKFIDLTDLLMEENKKRKVYFEKDSHLNSYGQSIVGRYLAENIKL